MILITKKFLRLLMSAGLMTTPSLVACSGASVGDSPQEGANDSSTDATSETSASSTGGTTSELGTGGSGSADVASGGTESLNSDPMCLRGLPDEGATVCCPTSCGSCGGPACADRPGGNSECCTGRITDSGISCDSATAPCILGHTTSSGGNSGTGGNEGSGGGAGTDVPQPPASCSNIAYDIPDYVEVHTVIDKHVSRAEFPDFEKWYTEEGNVQRFQLHEGDQNQQNPNILRPRVEAYAAREDVWSRNAQNDWHEFSANYYFDSWDSPWKYALFQIKTNDASNFIIQGVLEKDGSLSIARRGKGRIDLDDNVVQKPFHLRVRSNGYKFEVYYNCKLVLAEDHPQPDLENNQTRYGWRWGLYRQEEEEDDKQKGTTTMYVTGPKWD